MKLIFESLNDYEMATLEMVTLKESIGDKWNKGKKWISEQIKKMIAWVKAFVSKVVSKVTGGSQIEVLDISKLKDPTEIYSPTIDENVDMLEYVIMQCGLKFTYSAGMSDEDCIKQAFGMKKAKKKDIENDVKKVEGFLKKIDDLNKRLNQISETKIVNKLIVVFNEILKVMTGTVSEAVKTQGGLDMLSDAEVTDIVNKESKTNYRSDDILFLNRRCRNDRRIRLYTDEDTFTVINNPLFNREELIKFAHDTTMYHDIGPDSDKPGK